MALIRSPRQTKRAFLTIDDAPSSTMTAKVDFLLARGIPAVWFCQGNLLEEHPELALNAVQKGFVLGNHSYSHPHFSDLDVSESVEQIERTDTLILDFYQRAGLAWLQRYFRFPYGDKGGGRGDDASSIGDSGRKDALQAVLKGMGYVSAPAEITYNYYRNRGLDRDIDWYWTYDTLDWKLDAPDPRDRVESVDGLLQRMDDDDPEGGKGLNHAGSTEIVLMHDHAETNEDFFRMIDRLIAKGLSFELPGQAGWKAG